MLMDLEWRFSDPPVMIVTSLNVFDRSIKQFSSGEVEEKYGLSFSLRVSLISAMEGSKSPTR